VPKLSVQAHQGARAESRRKILEIDLDGLDAVRERLAYEMRSS
jgi:hypothetical protein